MKNRTLSSKSPSWGSRKFTTKKEEMKGIKFVIARMWSFWKTNTKTIKSCMKHLPKPESLRFHWHVWLNLEVLLASLKSIHTSNRNQQTKWSLIKSWKIIWKGSQRRPKSQCKHFKQTETCSFSDLIKRSIVNWRLPTKAISHHSTIILFRISSIWCLQMSCTIKNTRMKPMKELQY